VEVNVRTVNPPLELLAGEQEVLSILTHINDVKFFNFGDWLDLQRIILELMDLLDVDKYKIDEKYEL
jgi:hypothetical protein